MRQSWEDADARNKHLLVSNLVLSLALLLSLGALIGRHEVVTFAPPKLMGVAKIGYNSANENYMKSQAVYFATLIGNVTPSNVEFVADALSGMVEASIYPAVRVKLKALAQDPQFNNASAAVVYAPSSVDYEPSSNKLFVSGTYSTVSSGNTGSPRQLVYELEMEVRDYRPVITFIDSYEGEPHTEKWKEQHKNNPAQSPGAIPQEQAR
jgi:conjugal transfer pilus assembly protein TraE